MEEDGERVQKRTNEEVDRYNMDDGKATQHPHGVSSPQGDGYNMDNGKVTWYPHGLSSPPPETLKGNILRLTINPN